MQQVQHKEKKKRRRKRRRERREEEKEENKEKEDTHAFVLVLALSSDEEKKKVTVIAHVPSSLVAKGLKANEWASKTAGVVGGKGGGKVYTSPLFHSVSLSSFLFIFFLISLFCFICSFMFAG